LAVGERTGEAGSRVSEVALGNSVDVIVPCYRYGHFLTECVESVLQQAAVSVRVLIIDDASPDNTAEVGAELARRDARVTFHKHQANSGHIATFNEGIEWASADYMLLLSADDYLLPGGLERATALLEENPAAGFAFGGVVILDETGAKRSSRPLARRAAAANSLVLSGKEFVELSGASNIVPTPTAVVRTDLQKRLGGYRRELRHAGDMEMWLRFAAQGLVGYVDADQAVYRRHRKNMSDSENVLSDLQQRRMALDCFFQIYLNGSTREKLKRRLLYDLGRQAVTQASGAFYAGDVGDSQELFQFGISVSPMARVSVASAKFACMRAIGAKRWGALRSLRRRLGGAGGERLPL
jgi:glycosyltransferase involved in cell wall biosynthesis